MPCSRMKRLTSVGEWLSLVEHLVRDQGVGGSNPLSPTNLSLAHSVVYAAFAASDCSSFFGTFGTTEGNSKPNPLFSAHFLRNGMSSLILS
jgi:hypothetical protein